MATEPRRYRFTTTEYHQMGEAGIFDEDDRVELIDGEIVEMAAIGPRHASNVVRLNMLFVQRLGDVAQVSVQNPVRLDDYSEPQPDFALLHPRPDFYRAKHPMPEDVYVLVEVADTTVTFDRRTKVPLYARSGVPEVWLVDLDQDAITVYTEPTPTGYRTARLVRRGEQLAPTALPDRALLVDDILG